MCWNVFLQEEEVPDEEILDFSHLVTYWSHHIISFMISQQASQMASLWYSYKCKNRKMCLPVQCLRNNSDKKICFGYRVFEANTNIDVCLVSNLLWHFCAAISCYLSATIYINICNKLPMYAGWIMGLALIWCIQSVYKYDWKVHD